MDDRALLVSVAIATTRVIVLFEYGISLLLWPRKTTIGRQTKEKANEPWPRKSHSVVVQAWDSERLNGVWQFPSYIDVLWYGVKVSEASGCGGIVPARPEISPPKQTYGKIQV
jgi:hypothetical protein